MCDACSRKKKERTLRNVSGEYLLSLVSIATKCAVGDYINQTKIPNIKENLQLHNLQKPV